MPVISTGRLFLLQRFRCDIYSSVLESMRRRIANGRAPFSDSPALSKQARYGPRCGCECREVKANASAEPPRLRAAVRSQRRQRVEWVTSGHPSTFLLPYAVVVSKAAFQHLKNLKPSNGALRIQNQLSNIQRPRHGDQGRASITPPEGGVGSANKQMRTPGLLAEGLPVSCVLCPLAPLLVVAGRYMGRYP